MAADMPKKSAFAVLQAASKRASKVQDKVVPPQKRARLSAEGGSSFEKCPLCGRATPVALLQGHVDACTGPAVPSQVASAEQRHTASSLRYMGSIGTRVVHDKSAADLEAQTQPVIDLTGDDPKGTQAESATPEPRSTKRSKDAFSKLMQHQRAHSSVHNFYLEAKPDGTWAWHWFLTTARSEAKLLATLAAMPQSKATRSSEKSKGAVDPRLGKQFGGDPPTAATSSSSRRTREAAQQVASTPAAEVRRERANETDAELQTPSFDKRQAELRQPSCEVSSAGRMEQQTPLARNGSGNSAHPDSPPALPQAAWHVMTQLSGTKLGGSPHVKLAIRLLTNAQPGDGGEITWDTGGLHSNEKASTGGGYKGSNSLLKSALQKNVRLCRPDSAVRCALHLIKEDPSEFLRRCCIVCLEDAILHPALPLLVWLMAAHAKGYVLGRRQVGRCLALVHHLASCPCRDWVSHEGGKPAAASALDLFEHAGGLQGEAALLVRCILMRAGYGGMAGDVELLKRSADMWAQRFSGCGGSPPGRLPEDSDSSASWLHFVWGLAGEAHARILSPGGIFDVTGIGPLVAADVPVSAVDFHVSSIVEELLGDAEIAEHVKVHGGEAASVVKRCMWRFSSSLNNKSDLATGELRAAAPDGYFESLWEVMAPKARTWAANFLARRFY